MRQLRVLGQVRAVTVVALSGGVRPIRTLVWIEVNSVARSGRTALANFVRDLRRLREEAGQPSLNQLVALSVDQERPLRRSTISDKLQGKSLPEWDFVVSFVETCRTFAAQSGRPLQAERAAISWWDREHLNMVRAIDEAQADERLTTAAKMELVRRRAIDAAPQATASVPVIPHHTAQPRQLPAAPWHFAGRESELVREWPPSAQAPHRGNNDDR